MRKRSLVRLLEAAIQVFSSDGYHAASISKIALTAGVSKSLTYHYFDSKSAILTALAEERLGEWLPLVVGLETIQNPSERLQFLISFVLEELVEKTDKLRFYNSLYLSNDGICAIEGAMKKYKDSFERLFRAEKKLFQDLGFIDPEEEAVFLRSTLQGICLEYILGSKEYPLEKMKKKVLARYGV
jgi:AcrR family transcriptional regulator